MPELFNLTGWAANSSAFEEWIIYIFIFVAVVLLIRYLISWFVSTLRQRGIISASTKSMLIRILDLIVIIVVILGVVESLTASLTPYIVVIALGIMLFVLFYYEIREFTAFITIQLQKYARGTWIEVYLPGQIRPIRGRIIDIEPFNSVLEDLYGSRVYLANSVLVNALIREYTPCVTMRISIDQPQSITLDDVLSVIKDAVRGTPFRMDETRTPINSVGGNRLTFTLRLIPLSTPVRSTDLYKLMRRISNVLSNYNPYIEIIEK